MATFPESVLGWPSKSKAKAQRSALRSALTAFAVHPEYNPPKERLLSKLSGLANYESAKRRATGVLRATLADRRKFESKFQQIKFEFNETAVVPRPAIKKQLNDWWAEGNHINPLAVTGEEGMGKNLGCLSVAQQQDGIGKFPYRSARFSSQGGIF